KSPRSAMLAPFRLGSAFGAGFGCCCAHGAGGDAGPALERTTEAAHTAEAELLGDHLEGHGRDFYPFLGAGSSRLVEQLGIRRAHLMETAPERPRARLQRTRQLFEIGRGAACRSELSPHLGDQAVLRSEAGRLSVAILLGEGGRRGVRSGDG